MIARWAYLDISMTPELQSKHIYDVIRKGAWQTVYAMLCQIFNDVTIWNSFNRNFRFSQTNNFLKSFNSVFEVRKSADQQKKSFIVYIYFPRDHYSQLGLSYNQPMQTEWLSQA